MVPTGVLKRISLQKGCPCKTINMCRLSFFKILKYPEEDSTAQIFKKLSNQSHALNGDQLLFTSPGGPVLSPCERVLHLQAHLL